jgi:DHA2 family multidrug resistance protein
MVFYINIPIGIVALLLSVGYLPRRPVADIKTDWVGMGLLVLAVGALQYVLDQGQTREWFHSKAIVAGTIIAIFAGAAFFIRGWNKSDNIIDLSLLRDRNFAAGTLAMTAYGISLLGWMAIMPLFSQRLLGYSPATAGTLFIPRGLVSAITLAITGGILIRMFDARHLVIAGLVMTALGTLPMAYFSLYVDYWGIATPGMIAGIGSGLFFVPLTAVAFASIPKAQYDEAAGVYALMRGIGASAGIAIVSWLFVRQTQIHFNELTAHITPYNPDIVPYLGQHGLKPYSPEAAPLIVHEIARQAQMLAFNDIFWFIAMVTLCIIPLIFVMKRPEKVSLVPA